MEDRLTSDTSTQASRSGNDGSQSELSDSEGSQHQAAAAVEVGRSPNDTAAAAPPDAAGQAADEEPNEEDTETPMEEPSADAAEPPAAAGAVSGAAPRIAAAAIPNQENEQNLRLYVRLFEHAYGCRSQNCGSTNCREMKINIRHAQKCRSKIGGGCRVCKRFWILLRAHVRQCRDSARCFVPQCAEARQRLAQFQEFRQAREAETAHDALLLQMGPQRQQAGEEENDESRAEQESPQQEASVAAGDDGKQGVSEGNQVARSDISQPGGQQVDGNIQTAKAQDEASGEEPQTKQARLTQELEDKLDAESESARPALKTGKEQGEDEKKNEKSKADESQASALRGLEKLRFEEKQGPGAGLMAQGGLLLNFGQKGKTEERKDESNRAKSNPLWLARMKMYDHAYNCDDSDCSTPGCAHTKECLSKGRTRAGPAQGDCVTCKGIWEQNLQALSGGVDGPERRLPDEPDQKLASRAAAKAGGQRKRSRSPAPSPAST